MVDGPPPSVRSYSHSVNRMTKHYYSHSELESAIYDCMYMNVCMAHQPDTIVKHSLKNIAKAEFRDTRTHSNALSHYEKFKCKKKNELFQK